MKEKSKGEVEEGENGEVGGVEEGEGSSDDDIVEQVGLLTAGFTGADMTLLVRRYDNM